MSAGLSGADIPARETMEVVSVGLPFCAFKIAAGTVLPFGGVLIALGVLDLAFNAANLAGLVLIRRRVLDACFFSFAARLFSAPLKKSRWTLNDFGNSLDVLLSFSLVAYMIGRGRLGALSPSLMKAWNAAVVLNVLGAGLGRFTDSFRNLAGNSSLD